MKKGFIVGLALLTIFAMVGCKTDEGGGGDKVTVSFNLNWPADNATAAPAAPGSIEIDKDTGRLTTANLAYTGTTPAGFTFGNWFLSKEEADRSGQGGRVTTGTAFGGNKEVFARWVPGSGSGDLDLTGIVEEVNLNNGAYAVFQFTLPANKTWGDYKGISVDYAATAENFKKQARRIAIMGNYLLPEDFSFVTGEGENEGYKKAYAAFSNTADLNKNAQYMMHISDDNTTVEDLMGKFGGGEEAAANKWITFTYPEIADWTPHGSFVASHQPTDAATGPFYIALGLSTGGNSNSAADNMTLYMRNVKLIGKSASDTVTAAPAIFQMNGETYPAFCGWPEVGAVHYGLIKRDSVGTVEITPIPVTVEDKTTDVVFDYNYPADTLTQPAADARTKTTDSNGRLSTDGQLAALSGTAVPDGWKFDGWFTAGTGGTAVTAATVHAANATIYAQWSVQTIEPATTPLVIDAASTPALHFTVFGSNNKAEYDVGTGIATHTGTAAGTALTANEWALMVSTDFSGSFGGGGYHSLAAAQFPADELEKFLYNTVTIYYETAVPSKIKGTKDGAEVEVAVTPSEDGLKVGVKNAYNNWSDITGGYPTLTANGTGSYTAAYGLFNPTAGDGPGFSMQRNGGTDGWLLKITKIEFSYVAAE